MLGGEIEPYYKTGYNWESYKWCNGSATSLTKYNTSSDYGTVVDNKTVLEEVDDVAHMELGGKWRMPTDAEWTTLRENCNWEWTTQSGVRGYLVTGNNNSIFLPVAGLRYDSNLGSAGNYGYYWSSSLSTDRPNSAWSVYFNSVYMGRDHYSRCFGVSVRPVYAE